MIDLREAVRKRVIHSLSPQTAAMAGLQVQHLQQFTETARTFEPSDEQIADLARYFNIQVPT